MQRQPQTFYEASEVFALAWRQLREAVVAQVYRVLYPALVWLNRQMTRLLRWLTRGVA